MGSAETTPSALLQSKFESTLLHPTHSGAPLFGTVIVHSNANFPLPHKRISDTAVGYTISLVGFTSVYGMLS